MSVTDYTKSHNIWQIPMFNSQLKCNLLSPIKAWLNGIKIKNQKLAHVICQFIPSQCPFAREIKIKNITLVKIPPLCKLNPLYDELMNLRFQAISYLADECGEDISLYC